MNDSKSQDAKASLIATAFGALRFSMVASIATVAFGVATNKAISVVTGARGLALLSLYRTLGAAVAAVVPLGANDVVTRRISTATRAQDTGKIIGAALVLFFLQAGAILITAALLATPVARALFGNSAAPAHVVEVRLVLALTCGIVGLQAVIAVLSGFAQVKQVSTIGLATAAATMATVYPFLRFGDLGLALVIGATCFVGAALGVWFVHRALGATKLELPRNLRALKEAIPLSPWLAIHPIVITGSTLGVQSLLARHCGLGALGYFSAASLLENTAVMVLTSSMRSYYLPALGKLPDQREKRLLTDRMAVMLFAAIFAGMAVLFVASPLIIRTLFSADLAPARDLVLVMMTSTVGQMFVWFSAMFLLHKGDYRALLMIDGLWAVVRVGGTAAFATSGQPILSAAWVHVGAYTLSAAVYGVVIARRHQGSLFGLRTLILGFCLFMSCVVGTVMVIKHLQG